MQRRHVTTHNQACGSAFPEIKQLPSSGSDVRMSRRREKVLCAKKAMGRKKQTSASSSPCVTLT